MRDREGYQVRIVLSKLSSSVFLLLVFTLPVAAMAPPSGVVSDTPLLFTGVRVIDVAGGVATAPMDVRIEAGRVASVTPATADVVADGARVIPGAGRYLMPGLADMHAHNQYMHAPEEISLPLCIAHGVTTVREMSSDFIPSSPGSPNLARKRAWHAAIVSGALVGPRLARFGSEGLNGVPYLQDGYPECWRLRNAEEGRAVVHFLAAQGFDFIKVYNYIPRDAYFAVCEEAKRIGVEVSGHKPRKVSAIEAARAGQRTFEHARVLLFDSWPGAAEFRKGDAEGTVDECRQMLEGFDQAMCEEIFAAWKDHDCWYVPTHRTRRFEAMAGDKGFRDDPRLKYVPRELHKRWKSDVRAMRKRGRSGRDAQVLMDFYTKGLQLTRHAHEAGVNLLLGTDSNDTYIFPGSGVHDEMEEFARAGLAPADILRIATMNAARYLENQADYGTVEPGKVADLVLLERNPLDDIKNTRVIAGVTFNGWHYDRTALNALLAHAEEAAS